MGHPLSGHLRSRKVLVGLFAALALAGAGVLQVTAAAPRAEASVWNSCRDAARWLASFFYWVDTARSRTTGVAERPDGWVSELDLRIVRDHGAGTTSDREVRQAAGMMLANDRVWRTGHFNDHHQHNQAYDYNANPPFRGLVNSRGLIAVEDFRQAMVIPHNCNQRPGGSG